MNQKRLICYPLRRTYAAMSNAKYVNTAQSGKDNFEKDFQKSHVKTTPFQKFLLGMGSGVISLTSPYRGDMIAVMGEVTGYKAWEYIRSKMLRSAEGRKILEEKPRISSGAVDLEKLKTYPEGTLGKAYSNFLEKYVGIEGYTPDTRNAVQFVDNLELAYVAQRYREAHDLFHTLLGMPTNMLGEVTVKWVEAIQLKLPMCAAGALFGSVRLAPKLSRTFSTKSLVILETSLVNKLENKEISFRKHPGVLQLPCVELPKTIEANINLLIKSKNQSKSVLRQNADSLNRYVECRQVPPEKFEIEEKRKQLYEKLNTDDEECDEKTLRKVERLLQKTTYNWKPIKFQGEVGLQYLVSRGAAEYAVLKRIFNEIVQRDKDFAPKTLLDFGSGVGTVVWAANDFWGSTIDEYYCVDCSSSMNELAALILRENDIYNDPIIKNVYYRQFLPATPQISDIVVSSFTFFEIPDCKRRMKTLTTLWNNTSKYLVLVEAGTNAGFSLINEARDYLIMISKKFGVSCHVFAPCPHEFKCPRLDAPGNKTPCNFKVRYNPLSFYGGPDAKTQLFSFLVMKKGERPAKNERQWRIIRELRKRHKHVVCDVCTNQGDLRTTFVSASKYGKLAYRCIRSSNWGDLIPGVVKSIENETESPELISDGCDKTDGSRTDDQNDDETDESVKK